EDRGDLGLDAIQSSGENVIANATKTGNLTGLFTGFRSNTPWIELKIDRLKLNTMGVSMGEVTNTLQVYLGSLYINDFNRCGRTGRVNVAGSPNSRRGMEARK